MKILIWFFSVCMLIISTDALAQLDIRNIPVVGVQVRISTSTDARTGFARFYDKDLNVMCFVTYSLNHGKKLQPARYEDPQTTARSYDLNCHQQKPVTNDQIQKSWVDYGMSFKNTTTHSKPKLMHSFKGWRVPTKKMDPDAIQHEIYKDATLHRILARAGGYEQSGRYMNVPLDSRDIYALYVISSPVNAYPPSSSSIKLKKKYKTKKKRK